MTDDEIDADELLDLDKDDLIPVDGDDVRPMARVDAHADSSPDDWNPDHDLCGDYGEILCHGMKVWIGRVFRDTEKDRFMKVRDLWEKRGNGVLLKEVTPDVHTDDGFRPVDDGDVHELDWGDDGGRYIPV